MIDLKIATDVGPQFIRAAGPVPGLAIHREWREFEPVGRRWAISHRESGLRIAYGFATKTAALAAVVELAELTDWTENQRTIAAQKLKADVERIIAQHGGRR